MGLNGTLLHYSVVVVISIEIRNFKIFTFLVAFKSKFLITDDVPFCRRTFCR